MKFIKEENGIVSFIHNMPFHEKYGLNKTIEELEQEGILVENVPQEPDVEENQLPQLHINTETKEMWYEVIITE